MTPAEPNRPNASAPGFALVIPLTLMVLLPDATLGLRVYSRPEFGPFD